MFSGFKLSPSDYVDTNPKLASLSPLGLKIPPPLVYPPEEEAEEAPVLPSVPKGSSIQKKPWIIH